MPAKTTPTLASQVATLTEQVGTLAALVTALAEQNTRDEVGVVVEAPSKSAKPKPKSRKTTRKAPANKTREYRWRPWACARFGIPTKVGGTFDYVSKRSGSTRTHVVVRVDGDEVFSRIA